MSTWASDVPISMPRPYKPESPGLVQMGGFIFTEHGIAHDLTEADVEELSTPYFAPDGMDE